MIIASTTDTILASPVISVMLGGIGTGIVATVVGVFRVLSSLQSLKQHVTDMDKVLTELRHDMDVIKWGAVAAAALQRQQATFPPEEQP